MLENITIGLLTMVICLTIQCILVTMVVYILLVLVKKGILDEMRFPGFTILLVGVMLILLVGNLFQAFIWAALFRVYGEFTDFATAFYHSLVSFATLGYGDIVMSEQRRLLGAMEAANGSLMLGLTTGFLFAIINFLARRRLHGILDTEGYLNG
jgi:hypothetical protein